MARYGRLLSDAQWEKIRPLLPKRPSRPRGGRLLAPDRKALEGILWILRSGARPCKENHFRRPDRITLARNPLNSYIIGQDKLMQKFPSRENISFPSHSSSGRRISPRFQPLAPPFPYIS